MVSIKKKPKKEGKDSRTPSGSSKLKKVKSNVSSASDTAAVAGSMLWFDEDGMEMVRRSDRIKTIEVIKQHHTEMKIAAKIKKHISQGSPGDNQVRVLTNTSNTP